jgi:hypothetical protein
MTEAHSGSRPGWSELEIGDPEIYEAIQREARCQLEKLELIASENYVSRAGLEATGSVLTNKYAEGYPGRRYYGGCGHVDTVEDLARERAMKALLLLTITGILRPIGLRTSPGPATYEGLHDGGPFASHDHGDPSPNWTQDKSRPRYLEKGLHFGGLSLSMIMGIFRPDGLRTSPGPATYEGLHDGGPSASHDHGDPSPWRAQYRDRPRRPALNLQQRMWVGPHAGKGSCVELSGAQAGK